MEILSTSIDLDIQKWEASANPHHVLDEILEHNAYQAGFIWYNYNTP